MSASPLLELAGIDSYYGLIQALFDLSLAVPKGKIVCLLGGNASGKSTVMKVILGLVKLRSGWVRFAGEDITGFSTPQIVRRGIASVPEARRLFPAMTVRENLLMGAYLRSDAARVAEDLADLLDRFPRLGERLAQRAGTLSGGEQQMVAMAAR
jgi:branched-chain amino acid transport system ATP-binding protein